MKDQRVLVREELSFQGAAQLEREVLKTARVEGQGTQGGVDVL